MTSSTGFAQTDLLLWSDTLDALAELLEVDGIRILTFHGSKLTPLIERNLTGDRAGFSGSEAMLTEVASSGTEIISDQLPGSRRAVLPMLATDGRLLGLLEAVSHAPDKGRFSALHLRLTRQILGGIVAQMAGQLSPGAAPLDAPFGLGAQPSDDGAVAWGEDADADQPPPEAVPSWPREKLRTSEERAEAALLVQGALSEPLLTVDGIVDFDLSETQGDSRTVPTGSVEELSLRLRRTEDALRFSEQRFRLLVENALDDFFMHDDQGRFLDVNERACRHHGYTRDELMRMSASDISNDLSQAEKEELYRATPPGATARVLATHTRKDGSTFPVEVLISCHMFAGRKTFLGMVRDISEQVASRKALEEMNVELERRVEERTRELRETGDQLHSVLESASDSINLCDLDGRVVLVNSTNARGLGLARDEMVGKRLVDLVPDWLRESVDEALRRVIATGEATHTEDYGAPGDDPRINMTTSTPRFDDDGKVIGVVSVTRDMTDRLHADAQLRIERERMVLAAEVGGLGVLEYRVTDGSYAVNSEWLRITGREEETPPPSFDTFLAQVHEDDRARVTADFEAVVAGGRRERVQFRLRRPDGDIVWLLASGQQVPRSTVMDARALIALQDVTERVQWERRLTESHALLAQAERMARIGSWTLHAESGVFTASDIMYEMNGVPLGQPITVEDLRKMMPPDDFSRVGAAIARCFEDGQPYQVDVIHFTPEGGQFEANIRGEARRDETGRIIAVSGTVQDISEREAARAQMSAIADSLPNGAIYRLENISPVIGLQDVPESVGQMRLSYVSAGIERLTGFTPEEMMADMGRYFSAVHPDDRERYLAASRQATARMRNFECEFRLIKRDGSIIWLQARAAPRQLGTVMVWDGIIMDVSAMHDAAEALRRAKDEAEAAERAKGDFLATMSHEIRTPMNSVLGMTRLALQTELNARQRNYLEKIDASARALLGLINDILDFSRIEAGGLELDVTEVALDSVLEQVSNATAVKAAEKGLDITWDIGVGVPRALLVDPLRLGQVLINLVGNAVKFTERGEITVRIRRQVDPAENQRDILQFAVEDSGIGIGEAQISSLFQPFSQGDSGTARHFGGTGLGLSICRRLVTMMGGEISVRSRPGEGSTFTFTIVAGQAEAGPALASEAPLAGLRVLVVDANATSRTSLASMVEYLGARAGREASGPEAIWSLNRALEDGQPYDLALIDARLEGMDGIDTAMRLRAEPRLAALGLVIMVNAQLRDDLHARLAALGHHGVLIKPATETLLRDAAAEALRDDTLSVARDRLLPDAAIPVELTGRRVLVVDDNAFNREVAGDFLELAGMEVVFAASGVQALELLQGERFDVVLMDMQMPELDGLETTRRIRDIAGLEELPVLALTAQARVEDREAAIEVGMFAHLTKPIDEQLMYAAIAAALQASRSGEGASTLARRMARETLRTSADEPVLAARRKRASGAVMATLPAIDLDRALARFRGDHRRLASMLELFLRDFSTVPGDSRGALHAGDATALSRLAHRVSGVAGYFAADALHAHAQHVERMVYEGNALSDPELARVAERFVVQLDAVLSACEAARRLLPELR